MFPPRRIEGRARNDSIADFRRRFVAAVAAVAAFLAFPTCAARAEIPAISPAADAAQALVSALRRHVAVLSGEIGERSVVRGDGLDRARRYVRRAFREAGLTVTEQSYPCEGRDVANLIADLPGTPAEAVPLVVGAHYDTAVGTPGADDNASSVAVMLELARRAARSRPAAPVRFVAFTLEESPNFGTRHQGSRVFIRRLLEGGGRIRGAIVLEMVGVTAPRQHYPLFLRWAGYPEAGDFIGVIGNRASRGFAAPIVAAMKRNPALPVESLFVWLNGWVLPDTRLSDHASFWDAGLQAVMVTDTAYFRNPRYHTAADRADTLDYAFMARLVGSLTLVLDDIAAPR